MRVLIVGATGMLGHRLLSVLGNNHEVVGTLRSQQAPAALADRITPGTRLIGGIDALSAGSLPAAIGQVRPDVVINCVGLVKQHRLARQALPAIDLNARLPHQLADWCEEAGSRLIHISTDCVFAGTRGNYREDDVTDAKDLYGRTKALGEVAERPHCLTIRTSIIGRELAGNQGLLEWFLGQRGPIQGFRRAVFSGLPTDELGAILDRHVLPDTELSGVYHVSAEPITKYELLTLFNEAFGREVVVVPDDEFHIDRSLNSDRFRSRTGFRPAPWEQMVAAMAATGSMPGRPAPIAVGS